MSSIVHISLYCVLYCFAEKYERKNKVSQTSTKTLLILWYIFVEGLRYGRGPDQIFVYGPEYLKCTTGNLLRENMEPVYMFIIKTVRHIDLLVDVLPFGSIFMVYACIFIFCLLKLHMAYEKCTKHFILFALLATLYLIEWPIRTGVGFSFMLPAIYYLYNVNWEKWKTDRHLGLAIVFLIIPPFIHKGDALGSFFILLFFLLCNKKVISWKVSLPIFLVLEISSSVTYIMEPLFSYLSTFDFMESGDEKVLHYLDSSTFENEVEQGQDAVRSTFTQILAVCYYSSMIIVGYIVCKAKQESIWIYNLFVCSIMIAEPFRLMGSLIRMFTPTSVLWFIPMSMASFYYKEFKRNNIFWGCYWFFIAYLFMYYGRFVFLNPTAQYIWSV